MKELVEKLCGLERDIAQQKGDFTLFALFLREEAQDKWDVVASAAWFWSDKKKTLDFLARKLRSRLTDEELLAISRIVLVDEADPALLAIRRAVHVEHGTTEVRDSEFFGLNIRHAYIITSKRNGKVENSRSPNKITKGRNR